MKKGTIVGKSQIILAVMVLALAAAVWFNVKYSSDSKNGNKYLGQAEFVDNTSENVVDVGAKADYFTSAKKERDAAREETKAGLQETIKSAGNNTDAITSAVDKASSIAARETAEQNIEALLKAKGFTKSIAIIGDNDINVVVEADSLTTGQTLQIQDIASAQSGYAADKIKILTVK